LQQQAQHLPALRIHQLLEPVVRQCRGRRQGGTDPGACPECL
jgi:hypothetical protein